MLSQAPVNLLNIEDVDDIVSDIEPTRSGIPVLIRQYIALGGRVLAFNVDPEFSYALDGLMFLDLLHGDRPRLSRYLGPEALSALEKRHLSPRRGVA